MEIQKVVEISELLDIYGKLLTKKQLEVIEQYYNEDLSLTEISENLEISRQAVYDTIKRSEKLLYEYEKNIGFKKLKDRRLKEIDDILISLNKLRKSVDNEDFLNKVDSIIDYCEGLSE